MKKYTHSFSLMFDLATDIENPLELSTQDFINVMKAQIDELSSRSVQELIDSFEFLETEFATPEE